MQGFSEHLKQSVIKGLFGAAVLLLAYHLALRAGVLIKVDYGSELAPAAQLRHWGLEFAAAALAMSGCAFLGRRGAAVYGAFFACEAAVAVLCRMPVGRYELLCMLLFPLTYTAAACAVWYGGRLRRWILALFVFWGALQYGIYIAYIHRFGGRTSAAAFMAVFATNPSEAGGFLQNQFGLPYVLLAAALTAGLTAWALFFGRGPSVCRHYCAGAALIFVAAAAAAFGTRSRSDYYSTLFFDMRGGLKELYLAKKYAVSDPAERAAAAAALHPVSHGSGICLVVIGESANRNHWHCCGYDRETTPWADTDPHAVVFSQAYSCFTHTEPAVTMALSRFNNYSAAPGGAEPSGMSDSVHGGSMMPRIISSPALPDVLRAAGVQTAWLSSQNRYGVYDNFVTAYLALAADSMIFTRSLPVVTRLKPSDDMLLPYVKKALEAVPADGSAVIFVHLLGSHWPYAVAVPENWPFLPPCARVEALTPELRGTINDYDRTIAFTDRILGSLAGLLRETGRPAAMIYFSDHSEDVDGANGHNFDALTAEMTEIPALFWYSDEYASRWPQTVAQIKANRERIFTNDLAYELILGTVHVTCSGLDERLQFTSPHYAVTADNARFWRGRLLAGIVPGLKSEAAVRQ